MSGVSLEEELSAELLNFYGYPFASVFMGEERCRYTSCLLLNSHE